MIQLFFCKSSTIFYIHTLHTHIHTVSAWCFCRNLNFFHCLWRLTIRTNLFRIRCIWVWCVCCKLIKGTQQIYFISPKNEMYMSMHRPTLGVQMLLFISPSECSSFNLFYCCGCCVAYFFLYHSLTLSLSFCLSLSIDHIFFSFGCWHFIGLHPNNK